MAAFEGHAPLPDPDEVRDPRAAELHRHSRAETTRDKYRYFLGVYTQWCSLVGRRDAPATQETLEAFITFLAYDWVVQRGKHKGSVGMSPNSIRLAMAAVRAWHRVQGMSPPDTGLALQALKGHERKRAKDPAFSDGKGAPGLRLPTLVEMFDACDPDTVQGARDMALLSLGWAMMARRSELAGLELDHVGRPGRNGGLEVFVARSKTDQLGRGVRVGIPDKPELGVMNPVANVTRWQAVLADHGVVDGGFFRAVDQHGRMSGLPGYSGRSNLAYLQPPAVELVILRLAQAAMIPDWDKYTGHSLRRGGASDMYERGADILAIARQGRWGDRSPVVFKYIEDASTWMRNPLLVAKF